MAPLNCSSATRPVEAVDDPHEVEHVSGVARGELPGLPHVALVIEHGVLCQAGVRSEADCEEDDRDGGLHCRLHRSGVENGENAAVRRHGDRGDMRRTVSIREVMATSSACASCADLDEMTAS